MNNRLSSVIILNGVTMIDSGAFMGNQLINITIPDSVTDIWDGAFANNRLTSITIGADVELFPGAFGYGFEESYISGGRLAGTYARQSIDSTVWIRQ